MSFGRWLAASLGLHAAAAAVLWAAFGAPSAGDLVIDLTSSSFAGAVLPGGVPGTGNTTAGRPEVPEAAGEIPPPEGYAPGEAGGALTSMPQLRDRTALREKLGRFYPPRERARGAEGTVLLEVVVTAEGRVADARILEGGSPDFAAAALELVRELAFVPAVVGGRPASVKIRLPVRFELK